MLYGPNGQRIRGAWPILCASTKIVFQILHILEIQVTQLGRTLWHLILPINRTDETVTITICAACFQCIFPFLAHLLWTGRVPWPKQLKNISLPNGLFYRLTPFLTRANCTGINPDIIPQCQLWFEILINNVAILSWIRYKDLLMEISSSHNRSDRFRRIYIGHHLYRTVNMGKASIP